MDFLTNIFSFITDSTKNIGHKAVTIVALLLFIYIADNLIGFSYYSNVDNKIEVVEKINLVLKDSSLKQIDKVALIKMRTSTISRSSIKDLVWNFLTDQKTDKEQNQPGYNSTWLLNFISSTWACLFILLISVFVPFAETRYRRVLLTVIVIIMSLLTALILNKVIWLIPPINGSIVLNHVIGFVVNLSIIVALTKKRTR